MARKAGKVTFGYDASIRACLCNRCNLIICSEDMAAKQVKGLKTVVEGLNIKMLRLGKKKEFGEAFNMRDVGIICIEDKNFAKGILKLVN